MKKRRKKQYKTAYSTVSLPKPLVEKIKKTIRGSGYVSVSDFVTDVLRTVLINGERRKDEKVFSKEDMMRITERLRGLGYIK